MSKADSKANASGESESIADKYFVCTECLVEGNVQSFVDLFYLTHAVATADDSEINAISNYETLQFLKNRLTEAEVSGRQGQYTQVFVAYLEVAKHFQAQHDYKTGVFFLGKALDVARKGNDVAREAEATSLLGLAHERMGNLRTAIEYHERNRELIASSGQGDDKEAGRHLVGAYKAYAEVLQRNGDLDAAIGLLDKSLAAAKQMGDVGGEGRAYELLGQAYLANKACARLGRLYKACNDFKQSVTYLNKAFEISRSLGDVRGVEEARVNLGVAKGCARKAALLQVVKSDMEALLAWKNRRTPFQPQLP